MERNVPGSISGSSRGSVEARLQDRDSIRTCVWMCSHACGQLTRLDLTYPLKAFSISWCKSFSSENVLSKLLIFTKKNCTQLGKMFLCHFLFTLPLQPGLMGQKHCSYTHWASQIFVCVQLCVCFLSGAVTQWVWRHRLSQPSLLRSRFVTQEFLNCRWTAACCLSSCSFFICWLLCLSSTSTSTRQFGGTHTATLLPLLLL